MHPKLSCSWQVENLPHVAHDSGISGYLGLFSLLMCFLSPFAVLTGVIAMFEMRRNPRLSGWGRAIVGIVLGAIGSVGMVIMVIALASGR